MAASNPQTEENVHNPSLANQNRPHFLNQKVQGKQTDFSVFGRIGDTEGLIILDSGAQISLVDRRVDAKNLNPSNLSIRGVTGAKLSIYGQTNQVVTLSPKVRFNCSLIVTELPEGYIGILGLDVMEKEKIDLIISRGSIQIHGQELFTSNKNPLQETCTENLAAPVTADVGQGHVVRDDVMLSLDSHCFRVHCQQVVNLPAKSETILPVKLGKLNGSLKNTLEGKSVVIEPEEITVHGVYVARTLTKINNQCCLARVINCSDEELSLKKNTILGTITDPGKFEKSSDSNETSKFVNVVNNVPQVDERFKILVDERLSHLPLDERVKLQSVIYEFKDIFSVEESGTLGCTSAVTHTVETGNAAPIKVRPYRIPHALKPVVDDLIEQQLEEGVITPSMSPWSSPLIILPKKIGPDNVQRYRAVVDFRAVNNITTPVNYPIPDIRETLDKLGGSKYFSALDMNQGFYQIKMDPESQSKTAFTVPDGKYVGSYEYTRMPLGLRNSPSTFQRFMDTTLVGLRGNTCLIYLDDCLIYGSNIDQHCRDLKGVLQRFKDVNLSVKLQKCRFAMEEVEYLGHTLNQEGVRPLKKKVEVIENYPQPKNVKEVRGFLGLSGYYRRHIPQYAEIAKPLTHLTKKNQNFEWSADCDKAFLTLKQALVSEPLLVYPDFSKPFILSTDASNQSVGAILSNVIDGNEHPICYASRQLSPCEKNYTTFEKELLAVIWAVKYFRCYLTNVHFTLYTDHSSIKWLLSLKDSTSRLTRWALKLQQYNYTVVHKPGTKHLNADALSRVVYRNKVDLHPTIDLDSLRDEQKQDQECQSLKLMKSYKTSPQGIIYHESNGKKLILVPKKLRGKVMKLHHDIPSAGHSAVLKTLKRVKDRFVWPGIKEDVRAYVQQCHSCSQRRNYGRIIAPLGKFEEPNQVFSRISCDIVGPLPLSQAGNRYVLSIVDHFSRYTEFVALPDQTSETVARALMHRYISRYGIPRELITDQGGNFTSDLIKHLCKFLKVKKLNTTSYHPMSNGRTEVTHKTLEKMLSHYVNNNQNDWDMHLSLVCMAVNSQYHESTGYSPYEIVFGRKMETPLEGDLTITNSTEIYDNHVEDLRSKLLEINQLTREFQQKSRTKQKTQYDKKAKVRKYKVGQKVYLYVPQIKRHRVRKLARLWRGPYKITKIVSDLNVVLRIRKREVTVHINRIKPVFERTPSSHESSDSEETVNEDEGMAEPRPTTPQPSTSNNEQTPRLTTRPQRTRRAPTHLQDFEMD